MSVVIANVYIGRGRMLRPASGGGGSFPGYDLPGPGQTLAIGATNTVNSIAPAAFGATRLNYSFFNSYGSGIFVPDYSQGGAYCWGPSGGHQHPDFPCVVAFDYADRTFKLHEHTNGGTLYGGAQAELGYNISQTTGSPYYEITGSTNVPCPGHPYQNISWLPTALGGGSKGSILVVGRSAMGELGQAHTGSVHRFDLETNFWSRVTNNLASRAFYETGVLYDAARERYWYWTQGSESDTFMPYLRISDWTWQQASYGGAPPSVIGNAGRSWFYGGYIFMQCTDGTLRSFDPADPGSNILDTPLSGSMPENRNPFVYYPRTNKLYTIAQTGGGTLTRLTPPASSPRTNTWTVDTVGVSPSLPRQTQAGDAGDATDQYGSSLHYVPSINRLAWVPGDAEDVYLLDPT